MVLFVFVLWVLLIGGRMVEFMVVRRGREVDAMTRESVAHGEIPALRGRLLDREGNVLAWSERHFELCWQQPADPELAAKAAQQIRDSLPWLPPFRVADASEGEEPPVLVLAQFLTPEEVLRVRRAKLSGLRTEPVMVRRYASLSPAQRRRVGEVTWDGARSVGVSGLEREHDALLSGEPGLYRVLVDKYGRWVPETWQVLQPMRPGYDVHVSMVQGR
jgi:cell division protein FtsI (penicillin-binding protein 3)